MANKKTVVQMYEELLAIPTLTEEQKNFLTKRIEITKKKNASGKDGEMTPKQKERAEQAEGYKTAILAVMGEGVQYYPADLVKALGNPDIVNTQKITPLLTEMVKEKRMVRDTVKGRSVYSLPPTTEVDEDTED